MKIPTKQKRLAISKDKQMKSKLQKGLIALLIAAFLGCISACGMFEWTDRNSTDSETTSSMEESESVNSDNNTDEGETSDKTENEQPQPDVEKPSEDSTQGGGENSDGAEDEDEKSSDGKVELPEDKFD